MKLCFPAPAVMVVLWLLQPAGMAVGQERPEKPAGRPEAAPIKVVEWRGGLAGPPALLIQAGGTDNDGNPIGGGFFPGGGVGGGGFAPGGGGGGFRPGGGGGGFAPAGGFRRPVEMPKLPGHSFAN